MSKTIHVALLEPYYGGSHAAFVDALVAHSRHRCTCVTLPARKWKWRMRGAALWFARNQRDWIEASPGRSVDVLLCSDMLSVADLRSLLSPGARTIPIVCYFHENQLTYPLPDESDRDYQYGMTNITSCLAADAVWFNSRSHLHDFVAAAGVLLAKMPDFVPPNVIDEIQNRASVVPPPVFLPPVNRSVESRSHPPRILWPHRWEYDKNPEPFFEALLKLQEAGQEFEIVLAGEQFRAAPPVFASALERLNRRIVHRGHVADRAEYACLLASCDLVVSTAHQETFGLAIAEAILAGCQPLLPNRLSYPELIPSSLHGECLYTPDSTLYGRLFRFMTGEGRLKTPENRSLADAIEANYGLEGSIRRIDDQLARVAIAGG